MREDKEYPTLPGHGEYNDPSLPGASLERDARKSRTGYFRVYSSYCSLSRLDRKFMGSRTPTVKSRPGSCPCENIAGCSPVTEGEITLEKSVHRIIISSHFQPFSFIFIPPSFLFFTHFHTFSCISAHFHAFPLIFMHFTHFPFSAISMHYHT
ncbi:UvrABC system protein C, partial [Frankliniella fusca]